MGKNMGFLSFLEFFNFQHNVLKTRLASTNSSHTLTYFRQRYSTIETQFKEKITKNRKNHKSIDKNNPIITSKI